LHQILGLIGCRSLFARRPCEVFPRIGCANILLSRHKLRDASPPRNPTSKQIYDGTSALWLNWGVAVLAGMTGPREPMPVQENGTSVHFFCVTVLTGEDRGSYNAFIDGGAANEQRLRSCLRFSGDYSHPAGLSGR
jgi:hypothetical protein